MKLAALAVRRAMFVGVALLSYGTCATVVRAQTVVHNYVPEFTTFTDAGSARTLCVIGYSVQKLGLVVNDFTFNIPTYYLTAKGWELAKATDKTIEAVQVGKGTEQISDIPSAPAKGGSYVISANLTFYVTPAGTKCSNITYEWADPTAGKLKTIAFYPYPSALAEISIYPKAEGNKFVSNYMTVDSSNVNDFQNPLDIVVEENTRAAFAYIGNPVESPLVNRVTVITGPPAQDGRTGGATSPFAKWLGTQHQQTKADKFTDLALAHPPYPYAMIISPDHYLHIVCQKENGTFIPSRDDCMKDEDIGLPLNLRSPLNTYYDSELGTFFDNAAGAIPLRVMGDAGTSKNSPYAAGPWTVDSNMASCPLYLTPDKHSLEFQNSAADVGGPPSHIILCNPLNQLMGLTGTIAAGDYSQKPAAEGDIQTATIKLTDDQCKQAPSYLGWNLTQPGANPVGYITSVHCVVNGDHTMTINVLDGPGKFEPATGKKTQNYCVSKGPNPDNPNTNNCPLPHLTPGWEWKFANVAWVANGGLGTAVPGESPSDIVFANDGAFAGWESTIYSGDLAGIGLSIGRNIVIAFNHGIANCNNVTMSTATAPAECAHVEALKAADMNPTSAATASDAYWSDEANWYPEDGTNNFYAQYLHTFRLPLDTPTTNIFVLPQKAISGTAKSNQDIPMGMAYGFAYDENPVYLSASAPAAQVPSKFDPIPTDWFADTSLMYVDIRVGP